MQTIKDYFSQHDHLARHLGIELLEVQSGSARARLNIQPCHLNGMGTLHGGAMFALADFCFAVAANSYGVVAVAIHVDIAYHRPASEGWIYAQAIETSRTSRLGYYTVKVFAENNSHLATFNGTCFIKGEPLPFASAAAK